MGKEETFPMLPGLSRDILTVSELNHTIKRMLERGLDSFWVIGEISNFRVPPSGHFYFTLKDPKSQIAAVMFRSQAQAMAFEPEDGMEVLCFGRVSLYSTRGDLQLYVESMEPRGKGALHLAFEQLKKRLWKEGLFDPARKRELPFLPKSIGIVTSLGGAALGDMLRILEDRFPQRRVIVRPVKVQGDGAASEVAEGIRELGESGLVDVMIGDAVSDALIF